METYLETHVAESAEDPDWDRFLQSTDLGQYQQSGMWARAKSCEGWRPLRMVYRKDRAIAGGFQLLHKPRPGGSIAYISKGPVLNRDDPDLWHRAVRDIAGIARQKKILALIVQQPDLSTAGSEVWACGDFSQDRLMEVITATLLFDLCAGMANFERSIHPDYMRKVRQARKRGVTVREGFRQDIDLFFQLMLTTCRRQGEKNPQPASPEALRAIWDAFAGSGCIRLTFAEVQGKTVAGQLNFIFGKRVVLYKKGWTAEHGDCRPNHMLTHDILDWAHRQGATTVDCSALGRDMAETLLAGKPLTEAHKQSRDMFNLCFGGRPQLLPQPRIFIPNPVVRAGYAAVTALPAVRRFVKRLL